MITSAIVNQNNPLMDTICFLHWTCPWLHCLC